MNPLNLAVIVPLDLSAWAQTAVGGAMVLAVPVALLAGLVSFFSPCVVPLLPGYLSYATGMSAADLANGSIHRGRMLAGTSLFVLGFASVFVGAGVVLGVVGRTLLTYQDTIMIIAGVVTIVMGLMFAGVLKIGQRDVRFTRAPTAGIAGAPLLGIVFGLGWTPCLGPTISVVINLALTEGSALRGGILAFVYALGLGTPFVIAGLAFSKMTSTLTFFRRHQLAMMRIGGTTMIVVGLLLVTGLWNQLTAVMRQWASQFITPL